MRFQTDRPASWQVCTACGNEMVETDRHPRCTACGGLLEIHHRPPTLTPAELLNRFTDRRGGSPGATASGVWRFREIVLPSAEEVISYPEGNTPLLHRVALDHWSGVEHLLLKHEGLNPTGSFKDRGMTVGVTQARRIGASAVACASTGNTAASLAAYAAQAGLPALVLVPRGRGANREAGPGPGIWSQDPPGPRRLRRLPSTGRGGQRAARRLSAQLDQSVSDRGAEDDRPRDAAAALLGIAGLDRLPRRQPGQHRGLRQSTARGAGVGADRALPRLAAVQAAGAAPFARSFAEGFVERHRVKAQTVATAIQIGNPASYDRAVAAMRETNGLVLSVTDAELLEAKAAIDAAGVGCEPASAVSVAGLRQLVRSGQVRPAERVVAVLTGHILKDPDLLLRYHQQTDPPPPGANRPIEIEPTLGEVERVLRQKA